jgi:hypothetical protein
MPYWLVCINCVENLSKHHHHHIKELRYIHMHIHMYLHVYVHIEICMYIYLYICKHICIYIGITYVGDTASSLWGERGNGGTL